MESLLPLLRELGRSRLAQTVEIRRWLHRHPEPSFGETRTAAHVAECLETWGIPCRKGIGGNGIKAVIEGTGGAGTPGDPDAVVALRADMDALPVQEATGLPFASENPGYMHACGHDAHTAMLLGCARILQELAPRFRGRVVCIFQPGEEETPGGAKALIEAGILEDPRPRIILGTHVNPGLPAGMAGFREGLMMASADDIKLRILGSGGHGASPHLCVDPVVIAAQVITALQTMTSRRADPATPTVLTFGRIRGEGATNVIPGHVDLEGTFRTVDEDWRERFLQELDGMIRGIARAMGGDAEITIERGYPVLRNDPELTRRARTHAEEILGSSRVADLPLVMWAEDFSRYGQVIPSCFYNLGIRNDANGWVHPLHSPRMMVDESILADGPALMAWMALRELEVPSLP